MTRIREEEEVKTANSLHCRTDVEGDTDVAELTQSEQHIH